jgi:hypothetical protein
MNKESFRMVLFLLVADKQSITNPDSGKNKKSVGNVCRMRDFDMITPLKEIRSPS